MAQEQDNEIVSREPNGQFWIEILSWDWKLTVALSSDLTPVEQRFQGGLSYVRSFLLFGRVVDPKESQGKTVRIWISPFGQDITFGLDDIDEVGRLYLSPATSAKADWSMSLMLPEDAIAPLATALGTVSKYLSIRIFDASADEASIDQYSFSSTWPEGVARLSDDR